jgi:hypothetical protein
MLKPMMGLAATGLLAVVLWKLLAVLLLPLFGVALALLFTVLKVAFWAGVILFAVWLFRRLSRREAVTA